MITKHAITSMETKQMLNTCMEAIVIYIVVDCGFSCL